MTLERVLTKQKCTIIVTGVMAVMLETRFITSGYARDSAIDLIIAYSLCRFENVFSETNRQKTVVAYLTNFPRKYSHILILHCSRAI